MKTAIIYTSKHGTTARIAEIIQTKLNNQGVQLFNLKKAKPNDLNDFDLIILGGSIYVGSVQKKLRKYVADNLNILLSKRIALFLVCMDKTEKRQEYLTNAFPPELREKAAAICFAGGEFRMDKMNFLERAIIKKITGKTENISEIDEAAIVEFVEKLKA